MTQIALTVALIFTVYFIGYAMGRKSIMDTIREMTKELVARELEEKEHDAIKM